MASLNSVRVFSKSRTHKEYKVKGQMELQTIFVMIRSSGRNKLNREENTRIWESQGNNKKINWRTDPRDIR